MIKPVIKPMIKPATLLLSLALACCWTPSASAQLTLATAQGAVGSTYDFGPVAVGDSLNVVFTLANTSAQQIFLTYLSVSGTGFSNPAQQQLPLPIPANGSVQFTIEFTPSLPGSYNAPLQINQDATAISVLLVATGIPGFTVTNSGVPLVNNQILNFGNVPTGTTQTLTLTLINPNQAATLPVNDSLQGSATFSVPPIQQATVAGGASVQVSVVFAPTVTGPQQATLTIGEVTLTLQGNGVVPGGGGGGGGGGTGTLPQPSIQLSPATLTSAQQATLSVNLASAATASGTGTVALTFQPSVTGVADDPTIAFSDGTRSSTFTVAEGASAGTFNGANSVQFGTGTTAGTLTFTVTLGTNTAQATAAIAATVIVIDASVIVRDAACDPTLLYCTTLNLQVQINGYDNTYSASEIEFTFYGSSGQTISPGIIQVDGAQAFQQYFAGSALGGVFGLSALFPVTGGDPSQVTAAVIQLTNSVGTTSTSRVNF
jgi:hypothetical protein